MVDPQPVDEALADELEHLRDASPRRPPGPPSARRPSSPMSKKRRLVAGAPVEVEELRAQERVAPERVLLLRRGHVVRDDVEHDAEAELRAAAPARGTPPRRRGRPRSASGRRRRSRASSRPRLHDGRQVEVRDARARAGTARARAHPRSRGAGRAGAGRWPGTRHASVPTRRRTTIERDSTVDSARGRDGLCAVLEPARRRSRARASSAAPNRRVGSVNVIGSWWPLKRSMNESSRTVLAAMACASGSRRRSGTRRPSSPRPRPQSRCVILRPSGRNHHTSGSPEPRTVAAGEEVAAAEGRVSRREARSATV